MKVEYFAVVLSFFSCILCDRLSKSNETGNVELFSITSDGRDLTQITRSKRINATEPVVNAHPSFSPDGRFMAFTSTKSGTPGIFIMRDGGNTMRRVTPDNIVSEVPSFSPDGLRIAFSGNNGGSFEIFTIKIDGTGLKQLTFNNATNDGPKYTPDGKYIVFSSDVNGTGNPKNRDLYIMDASSGKHLQRITFGMDNRFARSISPDGRRIVFSSTDNNIGNLFIVDINGKNMKKITNSTGNGSGFSPVPGWPVFNGAVTPAWSPDGKYIAYADNSAGNYRVYTVPVNNNFNVANSLTFQGNDISIGWQPILRKMKMIK